MPAKPLLPIVHIAVPAPLHQGFDYLALSDITDLTPGMRVRVPFGRSQVTGIVLELRASSTLAPARLRPIEAVLDHMAILPPDLFALGLWTSRYYHYPIGEVLHNMLPILLRQGQAAALSAEPCWQISNSAPPTTQLQRAPQQAALLESLAATPDGLSAHELQARHPNWQRSMQALCRKGWARQTQHTATLDYNIAGRCAEVKLNAEQAAAVAAICSQDCRFHTWLLEGVTGSGKTEVYLRLIEWMLAQQRQILILVPEIGLTPQLLERFRQRLSARMVVLHSSLSERERLNAWLHAAGGEADIILGTRSAVFTPLARPGLLIIDEEHDASFKQQEGFRYHARDIAVFRGKQLNIPVLLGSATPSLESLNNVMQQRYRRLPLSQRAGKAQPPRLAVVDMRSQPAGEMLSTRLIQAMQQHLGAGQQVLLFLNRRGYAPVVLCHDCGWNSACERCDAHMTYHQKTQRLRCHHCGSERCIAAQCPQCGSKNILPLGMGTERIEQQIQKCFPNEPVIRIDRDSTRRKGALQRALQQAASGEAHILIGTQMLAKGHHFPNITLVGILDIDQGLFSADFRGPEYMAQLIVQVAGRAGRVAQRGEVLLQTHQPDHPLLKTLISEGYDAFAQQALAEREAALLPPYTHMALLRAEATQATRALDFLQSLKLALSTFKLNGLEVLGPAAAPMERRAGRYRAHLLLQAGQRAVLHQGLNQLNSLLASNTKSRQVRWSLDIDPTEMF